MRSTSFEIERYKGAYLTGNFFVSVRLLKSQIFSCIQSIKHPPKNDKRPIFDFHIKPINKIVTGAGGGAFYAFHVFWRYVIGFYIKTDIPCGADMAYHLIVVIFVYSFIAKRYAVSKATHKQFKFSFGHNILSAVVTSAADCLYSLTVILYPARWDEHSSYCHRSPPARSSHVPWVSDTPRLW